MKLVVFGLTISSSWGNGHATLWRGLFKALSRMGHQLTFFERNMPYYAAARDWQTLPYGELVLYEHWSQIEARVSREIADCDSAMVTSYCPDALRATDAIAQSPHVIAIFYDLDTPVTLSQLRAGAAVPYLPPRGLGDFHLVLSYTGGAALEALQVNLGARRVRPLYGHVDPDVHRPAPARDCYRCDLSWLGTYAADRQRRLEDLFVQPARLRPRQRFLIGGAQYPGDFPWTQNVYFVRHVEPESHASFFSSSRMTLNVTREAMAQMGWCPSGRLFEAAACAATVVSDEWAGLEEFYTPGQEIVLGRTAGDILAALDADDTELNRIGQAARERTLDEHTSQHRARTLLAYLDELSQPAAAIPLTRTRAHGVEACGE